MKKGEKFMEITNFITKDMLVTWMMALIMIELIVAFTKGLPFIKKIPTKAYTLVIALIHLLIINTEVPMFDFSIFGYWLLLCNAVVISVVLTGGYDMVIDKINVKVAEEKLSK